MPITTLRESIAFPEAGQIRKGEGKRKIQKNGYEVETVGRDLGCKFRVIFFEGEDNMKSKDRFFNNHRDNITMDKDTNFILAPARIVAVFPFSDAFRCWDFWYEAYIASRMVARSDGERFVRLIDPQTGGIKVSNGETFIPYTHGQVVGTYTNTKGKVTEIKCKPVGRLKVVLPELVRMCFMTIFTTSIYDISRITSQLRGLDLIARNIPQSNGVAGIPLAITRRMTEITWTQPDGSARRVKSALLNIEPDPDWVEKMLKRLSEMALPGGEAHNLLPSSEVQMDIPPQPEIEEGEEEEPEPSAKLSEETTIGGGTVAIDGGIHISSDPSIVHPDPRLIPNVPLTVENVRPYTPEVLRQWLFDRAQMHNQDVVTHDQKKYIQNIFSAALADDSSATKSTKITRWLFKIDNILDIPQNMLAAILFDWLKPTWDKGGAAHITGDVEREILAAYQMAVADAAPAAQSVATNESTQNINQEKLWKEVV